MVISSAERFMTLVMNIRRFDKMSSSGTKVLQLQSILNDKTNIYINTVVLTVHVVVRTNMACETHVDGTQSS